MTKLAFPYEGATTFKGYMRRVHGGLPYDWADLSLAEKLRYALRERSPRERRSPPRTRLRGSA